MENSPKEDMWRMYLKNIGMSVQTPQPSTKEQYREFFRMAGPIHLCKAVYTIPNNPLQVDYAIHSLECIVCGAISHPSGTTMEAAFKPRELESFFGQTRAQLLVKGWCSHVRDANNHLIVNTSSGECDALQLV